MKLSAQQGERVGLFGGSFDPPHWGHLILAQEALERGALDQLWFLPAGRNPHKAVGPQASAVERLAMLRAALGSTPRLGVCAYEAERPGPSYAIDTVRALATQFPGVAWHWLMGADQFPGLPRWHCLEQLVQEVSFLVFARPGATVTPPDVPGFRFEVVSSRLFELSSTDIRRRVGAGLPIDFLVPPSVLKAIQEAGLYRLPSSLSDPPA